MTDLKKVLWVFVVGVLSNACAMEIVPVPEIAILTHDYAKKFSSETFVQALSSYSKHIAPQKPCFEENCYKRTLTLDIATQLPFELQRSIIALALFGDSAPEQATNMADEFLRLPIAQALEAYAYKKEVDRGSAALNLKRKIQTRLATLSYQGHVYTDNVFTNMLSAYSLKKEIEMVESLLQSPHRFEEGISREELRALMKIVEKNPYLTGDTYDCFYDPHCNIKEKFTLSRFRKHLNDVVSATISPCAIAMGPLMVATLSRAIELHCCNKIVVESAVQENSMRELANAWMAKADDVRLIDYRFPMLSTMDYCIKDELKMYGSYLLGLFGWLALSAEMADRTRSVDRWQVAFAVIGGGLSYLALVFYIPRESVAQGCLAAMGFYGGACCVMAVIKARAVKKCKISYDEISKFLTRTDIEIQ